MKTALNVAALIFLAVAAAHLARLMFKVEVVIGSYAVPMKASLLAAAGALLLALWMLKSAK